MPCILKDDIKKLRAAITEKGGMTSLRHMLATERINFLAEYVDIPGRTDTAQWLNRRLEERLMKPSQVAATKEWIKRLEKKGDQITNKKAIIDRITAKKDVLNPKSSRPFMEGLAKQVMGFEVGREQASKMFEKAKTINELKKRLFSVMPNYGDIKSSEFSEIMAKNPEVEKARQELGKALVEFQKLYEEISLDAQATELREKGKGGKALDAVSRVAGNIKSMKASFDFSFLRQLQSTLYVSPAAFKKAMAAGYRAWFESQEGCDTMLADILTRPNALNGNYNKFGVEVGIKEEAFPESWVSQAIDASKTLEKFNAFRRSESSFNIAIQTARADLFDMMWEKSGGDIKLMKSQNVGAFINTVTGRGRFPFLVGKDEKTNRIVNNLLFAPKWLASRIETLIDLRYAPKFALGKANLIEAGRAKNALWNLAVMAVISNIIKAAIQGKDDDETLWDMLQRAFDPRSSDFGKIPVGTTRFDISTGTSAIVVMMSRVISGKTITLAGVKRDAKWSDVVSRFLEGKASPGLRTAYDLVYSGFTEEKKNLMGKPGPWDIKDKSLSEIAAYEGMQLLDFLAPISIQSTVETISAGVSGELQGLDLWAASGGVLMDIVGIAANTYDVSPADKGKSSQALDVEKRIAWHTDKQPISAKLASNTVVLRDKTKEQAERIQDEFAKGLAIRENALINSAKFKRASYDEKDEMLRDMRKKYYAEFKKKYEPKKSLKQNKKK